ncbi:hypothetical protein H4P12_14680 [Paracoccus sp. 11-3]|uniref:Uncharacterized protein n=1 Tax=Paracoccus amoyensis TaxID=2760093 RepID=A0A926GIG5_9RHOB|nr:hypothetical protein [Paracoccus amoyensis]MBC9247924.1 hypothetical protein [Paracoccus amoyensis]
MPKFLRLRKIAAIAATVSFIGLTQGVAQEMSLPGGFRPGSSLDEAKHHAASQGWKLVSLSAEQPSSWIVWDQKIGLHVCDNIVGGISQSIPGDVDQFARTVFEHQRERGQPSVQIVTFATGSIRISNIDARFPVKDGVGVVIQLGSTGGELAISSHYYAEGRCSAENQASVPNGG